MATSFGPGSGLSASTLNLTSFGPGSGISSSTLNLYSFGPGGGITVSYPPGARMINIGNSTDTSLVNIDAGTGGIDCDATGPIDLNSSLSDVTAISLTTSVATSGIDVNAGTVGIDVDSTGSIDLNSSKSAANAIYLRPSSVSGGIDVNSGTGGIDTDSTGQINIDSSLASSVAIVLNASATAGGLGINAGTGGFDLSTTGVFSIDGADGSNFYITSGNLTASTIASGNLILTGVNTSVDSTTDTTISASTSSLTLGRTSLSDIGVAANAIKFTDGAADHKIYVVTGTAEVAGRPIALESGDGGATAGAAIGGAGGNLTLHAGDGGAGDTSYDPGAGASLTLTAGDAGSQGGGSGNANGGSITVNAGNAAGTGTDGTVSLGISNTSAVNIAALGILTTIAGDLTVNGTVTAASTTNVKVEDGLILFRDSTGASTDAGMAAERGSTSTKDACLLWDDLNLTWQLAKYETSNGTALPPYTPAIADFVNVKAESLDLANGNITTTSTTGATIALDPDGTGVVASAAAVRLDEVSTPTFAADKGFIYPKDDGGDTELFYLDNDGTEIQITEDGLIYGGRSLNESATSAGVTQYYVVYLNTSTSKATHAVNTAAASSEVFGVALSTTSDTNPVFVTTKGRVRMKFKSGLTINVGDIAYLSETAGLATNVLPTTSTRSEIRLGKIYAKPNYGTGDNDDTCQVTLNIGEPALIS